MTISEDHLKRINDARTASEHRWALESASNHALSVEYEYFSDQLGQPMSCVNTFIFADSSRLRKVSGSGLFGTWASN